MLKKLLLGLLLACALYFLGRAVVLWLVSEETKIRWRLEEMSEAFNEPRLTPILAGLAPEFRVESGRVDRAQLADALRATFLQEKDPKTKAFLYLAELPSDQLAIEVEPEHERSATSNMQLLLYEKNGEQRELVWDTRIELSWSLTEEGWQITLADNRGDSGPLR